MKRRYLKEFRLLLAPFCVAAVAACLFVLFKSIERTVLVGGFVEFLFGFAGFALAACLVLMPAMSFGTEYGHRTLPFLLSQPLERFQLWKDKLLVVLAAFIGLGAFELLVNEVLQLPAGRHLILTLLTTLWPGIETVSGPPVGQGNLDDGVLAGTFLLVTLCSAGYWTLIARSTIGGAVFTAAGQFLALLPLIGLLEKLGISDSAQMRTIGVGGVIYAGTFLWLGWRKFARLELRHGPAGEGSFSALPQHRIFSFLRCRPAGLSLNLARKELRLQQPLFVTAGILALCWLLNLVLLWLQPARRELYNGIFLALTALYVPLATLLAGCVSLGEEKALGLPAWHLTLPVSLRRQWVVKLGVAFLVWAGLGLVFPFLLAWIASPVTSVGLFYLAEEGYESLAVLLALSGFLFALSFWSSTLFSNTIRAALAVLVVLNGLLLLGALAYWSATSLDGGLETPLLLVMPSHGFFSIDSLRKLDWAKCIIVTAFPFMSLIVLAQSSCQFRRPETRSNVIFKSVALIAVVALGIGFWFGDLQASLERSTELAATSQLDTTNLGESHSGVPP